MTDLTPPNSIRQRLAEGKLVRVMSVGALPSPKLVEMVGLLGKVHGIWIDQEHCAVPHQQLELLLLACRATGLDAFARVLPSDYGTIMRPMEAGCSGVMVAQIRRLEEVEQVVQWAKYPPRGVRGLFMGNAECRYGTARPNEHVTCANRDRWLAIQIETAEAVDQIDQIAAIEGVDLLFVGPADLACNLGVPGEVLHPKCLDALQRVSAAARAAQKPWGTLSRDPRHAVHCRELGCQLFSLLGDIDLIQRGLKASHEMFAALFED